MESDMTRLPGSAAHLAEGILHILDKLLAFFAIYNIVNVSFVY